MERYFELGDDMALSGRWLLKTPIDAQGRAIDSWSFYSGQRLSLPRELVCPLLRAGRPMDYCVTPLGVPVVSRKGKELFERLGETELQFFPVRVASHDEPWFLLNVIRRVDCIDESRSHRVERWKPEDGAPERVGEYRLVEVMRIDAGRVGGARIFRTWGWPVIVVAEDLQEAMEREGLVGPRFTQV